VLTVLASARYRLGATGGMNEFMEYRSAVAYSGTSGSAAPPRGLAGAEPDERPGPYPPAPGRRVPVAADPPGGAGYPGAGYAGAEYGGAEYAGAGAGARYRATTYSDAGYSKVEYADTDHPDPGYPDAAYREAGYEPGRSVRSGAPSTRRSGPIWPRLLVWFGAALMLLSGGTLVVARVALTRYTGAVHRENMLGGAGVANKPNPLEGPLNLLLVGVDERTQQDDPNGTRADSIIVLHVNAAHDAAYLLSVPRDTLVDIPAFAKSGYRGGREKINAAFQHGSEDGGGRTGGFELLATTVRAITGIGFNAGAIVNFAGFQAVVNALGGVDMCIDQRVVSIHLDRYGNRLRSGSTPAQYLPGCQHLEPWQALDYVRQRHTSDGDYDRQRHQQQFLKAIGKQALSKGVVTNPARLDAVLTAAGRTLTVDPGQASLTDWVFLLKSLGTDNLVMLRTNGGSFASLKCPDGSSCEQLNADSEKMFEAAKNDTVADFVQTHPTWVAPDK
jgi:LCP family protein required for cell wall assembly